MRGIYSWVNDKSDGLIPLSLFIALCAVSLLSSSDCDSFRRCAIVRRCCWCQRESIKIKMSNINIAINPEGIGTRIFLDGRDILAGVTEMTLKITPQGATVTISGSVMDKERQPLLIGTNLQHYSCSIALEDYGNINLQSPALGKLLKALID